MSKSQWEMGLRTLNYERVIVHAELEAKQLRGLRTLNYERVIVLWIRLLYLKISLRTLNYERVIVPTTYYILLILSSQIQIIDLFFKKSGFLQLK